MKIIDKKKDYYDYLTGIFGIDEKLILDRRDGYHSEFHQSYLRFYIAGYIIEGLCVDGKFYYSDTLNKFVLNKKSHHPSRHWNRDYSKSIYVTYNIDDNYTESDWIYREPIIDKDDINFRFDCPILLDLHPTWRDREVVKFPLLKDYSINKFIDAETIYQWIEAWLGKRITLSECSPELSNDNKIMSKGMSKKTSFKPKMK